QPDEWFGNVTETIGKVHHVEDGLVSQAVHRAQALRKRAIISAIAIGSAVLLVLIIALLFTVIVGRSMVRPLRRLRAGALEVAGRGGLRAAEAGCLSLCAGGLSGRARACRSMGSRLT